MVAFLPDRDPERRECDGAHAGLRGASLVVESATLASCHGPTVGVRRGVRLGFGLSRPLCARFEYISSPDSSKAESSFLVAGATDWERMMTTCYGRLCFGCGQGCRGIAIFPRILREYRQKCPSCISKKSGERSGCSVKAAPTFCRDGGGSTNRNSRELGEFFRCHSSFVLFGSTTLCNNVC